MSLSITLALLLTLSAPPPAPDQTGDALLLLKFAQAVKQGDYRQAQSLLSPDAFIGDYTQQNRSTFEQFADYARYCQLREVRLLPARKGERMPIGIKWLCPYPEPERDASFWFEEGRVTRIGWGKPVVIKIAPVRERR